MIARETFIELVKIIRDQGEVEYFTNDGIHYRNYTISELSLVISRVQDSWIPEGITFELFGTQFFLTPDGNITAADNEAGQTPDFYALTDQALLAIVASFLTWRLKVLKQLNV